VSATLTATGTGLPVTANLNAYHGDSWSQTFRLMQGANPVDLTGCIVTSSCRGTTGDTYTMQVFIDDPTQGTIRIEIPDGLQPDLYAYDIQVVDAGAVTTWVSGRLQLRGDVT
jgi:hypothetical protein